MERRLRFIVNITYIIIMIGIFFLAIKYALGAVLPFVLAFFIAWALQKPIALLCKRFPKLSEKRAALLVITAFWATIGVTATMLINGLLRELTEFADDIPSFIEKLLDAVNGASVQGYQWVKSLPEWLRQPLERVLERLDSNLPDYLLSVANTLASSLLGSVSAIGGLAMKLPSAIISVFFAVVASYFIGTDFSGVIAIVKNLCSRSLREKLGHVRKYSASTVLQLIKTYAFLMLLTFSELSVGFALMNLLGAMISHIIPLALITSLVDILPVLGVGTILLPWGIFELLRGDTTRGIMLLVLYIIILIVRNFLEPKLVGQRFGLHPAVTLLALYIGGRLFGFIGVFILPMVLIIIKRLHDSGAIKLNFSSE